jgi:hypothetical protein
MLILLFNLIINLLKIFLRIKTLKCCKKNYSLKLNYKKLKVRLFFNYLEKFKNLLE